MTLLLPVLAVAFAAFCVWLTVRIVNRKEQWAKWTLAVLVGLPVLYVASFGPACWWFSKPLPPMPMMVEDGKVTYVEFGKGRKKLAPAFYWPLGWLAMHSISPVHSAILWYATAGNADVIVPASPGPFWGE